MEQSSTVSNKRRITYGVDGTHTDECFDLIWFAYTCARSLSQVYTAPRLPHYLLSRKIAATTHTLFMNMSDFGVCTDRLEGGRLAFIHAMTLRLYY